MKRHPKSHLDHGLSSAQTDFLFKRFADRVGFFIETIELVGLGTIPCGLWGPAMGDPAIRDGGEVLPMKPGDYIVPAGIIGSKMDTWWQLPSFTGAITAAQRGAREWESRLIDLPCRPTNKVTVIAGPLDDEPCVLYTAYGGPSAPREPLDPSIEAGSIQQAESVKFWLDHAISKYAS